MATDLCLRVLKFSHAFGVRSDNSIPWTHLQASDIFAIVKGRDTDIADGKLDLNVVQGTTVLESLNVAKYIDSAQEARRGAESHGVRLEIEQLPIFGITKDALLALRYRNEPDGRQRRIQLRFEDVTQCRKIVSTFVQRGMEFQAQRPGTAKTDTARPTTSAGRERLLTANSSSPYFDADQSSRSSIISHQQLAPQNGRWPQTASHTQSAGFEGPTAAKETNETVAQHMGPPRFLSRDENTAPREAIPERPSTSQIYRSHTTSSQQISNQPQEFVRRPPDPVKERPSSTSRVSQFTAIREAVGDVATPPPTALGLRGPSAGITEVNANWTSGSPESIQLSALRSDPVKAPSASTRPSTPATTLPPEHYDLPPPRVLPFKRPASKSSSPGAQSTQLTKSAMILPRLPVSTAANRAASAAKQIEPPSTQKTDATSRPATSSPLKRTSDATSDAGSGHTASPTKKPRTSYDADPVEQVLRKPSGMQDLLNSHKTLAQRSANATLPRTDSLADAPYEIVSPTNSPSKLRTNQNILSSSSTIAAQQNETSLEEYATQSLADRQAALEEFMTNNLENPAFTKLCEDVENCWRRIALGL